jgi:hypothetical protein
MGTPGDIPFDPEVTQKVIHSYPDGDVILQDGTTTFDPERAYGFLVGQQEFDKAEGVKELIDRQPPQELPGAVIPPDQAVSPQTQLPSQPGEAPLDPTGGQPPMQGGPAPGAGQPNALPGGPTQVPPPPGGMGAPRVPMAASVEKNARKDFSYSEQKALIDENLDGRARNYDKLNLEGTHYEIEQEASVDDFDFL